VQEGTTHIHLLPHAKPCTSIKPVIILELIDFDTLFVVVHWRCQRHRVQGQQTVDDASSRVIVRKQDFCCVQVYLARMPGFVARRKWYLLVAHKLSKDCKVAQRHATDRLYAVAKARLLLASQIGYGRSSTRSLGLSLVCAKAPGIAIFSQAGEQSLLQSHPGNLRGQQQYHHFPQHRTNCTQAKHSWTSSASMCEGVQGRIRWSLLVAGSSSDDG
jgi:hypothetical protein